MRSATVNCTRKSLKARLPSEQAATRSIQNDSRGRIPAKAKNAAAYCEELGRFYKELEIVYEADPTGGLLHLLH